MFGGLNLEAAMQLAIYTLQLMIYSCLLKEATHVWTTSPKMINNPCNNLLPSRPIKQFRPTDSHTHPLVKTSNIGRVFTRVLTRSNASQKPPPAHTPDKVDTADAVTWERQNKALKA